MLVQVFQDPAYVAAVGEVVDQRLPQVALTGLVAVMRAGGQDVYGRRSAGGVVCPAVRAGGFRVTGTTT